MSGGLVQFLRERYTAERTRQQRIYRSTYESGALCPFCERPSWGMTTYIGDPGRLASFQPCGHEINDRATMSRFEEPDPDTKVIADLDAKEKILNAYERWQRRMDAGEELSQFERGALAELYSVCRMFAEAEGWKP